MTIPLTTADLSTTATNLKALIDGHLEDLWDKYGRWPVYSKFGPGVNPDASAILTSKN